VSEDVFKFAHEALNRSVPNRIALNRTMWSQTKACITKSLLFWAITQWRVVIPYRHFGTTYRSHLQGSRNPKERREHDWC